MNLTELQEILSLEDKVQEVDSARDAAATPIRLVPRINAQATAESDTSTQSSSIQDRLLEIETALKLGYLLCKCTWPPQIMVLTGSDHAYRCRRCSRVREM
jgi:hypothetical protein